MTTIYEYVRHPRIEELAASRPVKVAHLRGVDHESPIVRLNARVGLRVTLIVGTMWMAYLFTVLALIALPDAVKQGTYYIVVWLSSSFLQLVLLPISFWAKTFKPKRLTSVRKRHIRTLRRY
jgi:hypothetical protein